MKESYSNVHINKWTTIMNFKNFNSSFLLYSCFRFQTTRTRVSKLSTWYLKSKEKKRRISAESSSSIHSNTVVQQQPVNPGNTKTENQQ